MVGFETTSSSLDQHDITQQIDYASHIATTRPSLDTAVEGGMNLVSTCKPSPETPPGDRTLILAEVE